MVVSHGFTVDVTAQEVDFWIEFNDVPDFLTLDAFGRPADAFQYYFDPQGEITYPNGGDLLTEIIVRGSEIHIDGDLRIRDRDGIGGPNSGGWGPVRGAVPIQLIGTTLSFTAPFSLLDETDGLFSYRLETYEYGAIQQSVWSIPEPSPAALLLIGLVAWQTTARGTRERRRPDEQTAVQPTTALSTSPTGTCAGPLLTVAWRPPALRPWLWSER